MTDVRQDVRARLTRLAGHALPPADGSTLDRVLDMNRSRRLRAVRWVAAVVAVLVLGTAATLARPDAAPAVQAAPVTRAGSPPPAAYDQPPRGSLAGDAALLAELAALPWSPPPSGSGYARPFDPATRRVVYAADVPGGHRWAVVMASNGPQWVLNWFAGPSGAAPAELTEAFGPVQVSADEPVALMDVSADTGPLVVLTDPGVAAEYSATLDRAPDGTLVRTAVTLPEVDGVPLGLVRAPVAYGPDTSPELYVRRDGVRTPVESFLMTGTPPWTRTQYPTRPPDPAEVAECLVANGFTVEAAPPSAGVYFEDPRTGDLSSTEQADRERASEDCFIGAAQE
ncbi:hypothetical protein GCU67_02570 [Modestobacter muralis]|uniref:Uncharacterized protein n=1 Tax=Modestobacter muralis TaxID=1608614 RepID=A0A6P0EMV2_9ACTN|nr:hypothetical protein [Modestobacter muralis]NEK93061.1 hypothetical protein [Modestobacter muralis]NEN49828.1 hypothetical protein [Modestobacter muralis]